MVSGAVMVTVVAKVMVIVLILGALVGDHTDRGAELPPLGGVRGHAPDRVGLVRTAYCILYTL